MPNALDIGNGRMVANPGSVGLQAYWDDQPHPHIMATGSVDAHYTRVYKTSRGWSVQDIIVPYDWETAVRMAEKNGRTDWAQWLRTGKA